MPDIFFHNYEEPKGSFTHEVSHSIDASITLHPVKLPEQQHRLHYHFMEIVLKEKTYKIVLLRRKIQEMTGKFNCFFQRMSINAHILRLFYDLYQGEILNFVKKLIMDD